MLYWLTLTIAHDKFSFLIIHIFFCDYQQLQDWNAVSLAKWHGILFGANVHTFTLVDFSISLHFTDTKSVHFPING